MTRQVLADAPLWDSWRMRFNVGNRLPSGMFLNNQVYISKGNITTLSDLYVGHGTEKLGKHCFRACKSLSTFSAKLRKPSLLASAFIDFEKAGTTQTKKSFLGCASFTHCFW